LFILKEYYDYNIKEKSFVHLVNLLNHLVNLLCSINCAEGGLIVTKLSSDEFLEGKEFLFHVTPYQINNNERVQSHTHEFFELVYIAEGTGKHLYQRQTYRVSEGDVFVIEPQKEHGFEVDQNSRLLVYNILFEPALLVEEIKVLSQLNSFLDFFYVEPFLRKTVKFENHLALNYQEQIEMRLLVNRLVNDYNEKDLGYRILIKTRMLEMLIFLSRCYNRRNHKAMSEFLDHTDLINRLCEFIKAHYNRPLSLEQVSKLCGMGKSTFTSKFKKMFGKTFIQYRNEIRIKAAKDLLVNTNDKVMAIAYEVGFDDLSYFNKTFKHFTAYSPSKYRNQQNDWLRYRNVQTPKN
jgi:AraC-like DNA-binding protein/quercetin dioxygenase-like cupin family protein